MTARTGFDRESTLRELDTDAGVLRYHEAGDGPPLLLVHGGNDTNVPPTESQQMFEVLRALDRTVELLVFEDDGHEIVKRENRAALVNAMTTWLLKAFSATSVS